MVICSHHIISALHDYRPNPDDKAVMEIIKVRHVVNVFKMCYDAQPLRRLDPDILSHLRKFMTANRIAVSLWWL